MEYPGAGVAAGHPHGRCLLACRTLLVAIATPGRYAGIPSASPTDPMPRDTPARAVPARDRGDARGEPRDRDRRLWDHAERLGAPRHGERGEPAAAHAG